MLGSASCDGLNTFSDCWLLKPVYGLLCRNALDYVESDAAQENNNAGGADETAETEIISSESPLNRVVLKDWIFRRDKLHLETISGITAPQQWFLHHSLWPARFQRQKSIPFLKLLIFFPHYFTLCFIWKLNSTVSSLLLLPALEYIFRLFFWVSFPYCSLSKGVPNRSVNSPFPLHFTTFPFTFLRQWFQGITWTEWDGGIGAELKSWGRIFFLWFDSITVVRGAVNHFYSFIAGPQLDITHSMASFELHLQPSSTSQLPEPGWTSKCGLILAQ